MTIFKSHFILTAIEYYNVSNFMYLFILITINVSVTSLGTCPWKYMCMSFSAIYLKPKLAGLLDIGALQTGVPNLYITCSYPLPIFQELKMLF